MTSPGRPTKLTPELQATIIAALASGATRAETAALVGINQSTFHRWMIRGEEEPDGLYGTFRTEVLKAEGRVRVLVRASLFRAAQSGNVAAIKLFLAQKPPKEFLPTENHDPNLLEKLREQQYAFIRDPFTASLLEFHGLDDTPEREQLEAKILALLRSAWKLGG